MEIFSSIKKNSRMSLKQTILKKRKEMHIIISMK